MSMWQVVYLVCGVVGLLILRFDRRDQSLLHDDTGKVKPKNNFLFPAAITRYLPFQASQRDQYFYPADEKSTKGSSVIKLAAALTFGAILVPFISVPVVRWFYNVPPDFQGNLSSYSQEASQTIGFIFFIGLVLGPLLRGRTWHFLRLLFALGLIAFCGVSVVYYNL